MNAICIQGFTTLQYLTDSSQQSPRLLTKASLTLIIMISLEIYTSNIQGSGGSKIPELSARTADADFIILNETNTRAGHENSISLKNYL